MTWIDMTWKLRHDFQTAAILDLFIKIRDAGKSPKLPKKLKTIDYLENFGIFRKLRDI